MRISTTDIFQRITDNLNDQQILVVDMQSKVASGKLNLTPSDDPIAALKSMNYRYQVNDIQQMINNTYTALSYLEYEESIFNTVTNIYQRIQELTIYAGNGSLGGVDRNNIATEMSELLQELVSLANTMDANGDYLFSGFQSNTPPVIQNNAGNYQYQGDEGQRSVMIGDAIVITVSDPAKEIFFNIPTTKINGISTQGVAVITSASPSLVNAGTLNPLQVNDLIINNIPIPSAQYDGVSTSDSACSAIAICNAINSLSDEHGAFASVNPTSVNMGIYTANPLVANQFTLNGINIIDPNGTQDSLLNAINAQTSLTGVVATQPGGLGTDIFLTSFDGRNIQLQTNGLASATFSNFSLTMGALDEVMSATFTLTSHQSISIDGLHPNYAGLSVGTQGVSLNTGTGVIATPIIIDSIADPIQSYSITFNTPATTFNIVSDLDPSQVLPGFENVTYVPGQAMTFNGISVTITGMPNPGDVFGINLQTLGSQDVFTTIQNIINSIQTTTDPTQLSYEIGLGLSSLSTAVDIMTFVRAKIGARQNIVQNQQYYQELLMYVAQTNLSVVTDLDYNYAVTKLSEYNLVLQAAQQSFVKIQSLSIFNYIK